jgi:hypothetical protein
MTDGAQGRAIAPLGGEFKYDGRKETAIQGTFEKSKEEPTYKESSIIVDDAFGVYQRYDYTVGHQVYLALYKQFPIASPMLAASIRDRRAKI